METVLTHAIRACSVAGGPSTHTTGGSGLSVSTTSDWTGLVVSVAILLVFGLGIALAVVIANRISDRQVRVPIPIGAQVSPDGYYWWDGAAWRPRF